MSSEAIGVTAPLHDGDTIAVMPPSLQSSSSLSTASVSASASVPASVEAPEVVAKSTGLNSPPDSNNAVKLDGSDDSELSDLDEALAEELKLESDDDIGDIEPDHYSGTVPVFRPTMHQFKDFKIFMEKIDKYGMQSGIVKVIPPQEWKNSLPALDELVKTIRVREPIKQDIMGSNGTYRQVNILHQRSYNLPQWRQLCDQSEHQPPAKRGERRANADKPKPPPRTTRSAASAPSASAQTMRKGRRGRSAKKKQQPQQQPQQQQPPLPEEDVAAHPAEARPMTPESSKAEDEKPEEEQVVESIEDDPGIKVEDDEDDCASGVGGVASSVAGSEAPPPRRMGFTRQAAAKTQSTSARRKYSKREGSAKIDEAAFKDWDYRMDVSDYTPERCEELERIYWKTLTYAQPLYGADLPGTLFDESTEVWNLNKLPNLLDVLGTKVPGVNTAYLYLGMWKATFAWHLEDVDLYSINYLHFGAPKQWYSISQKDARRFEAAMKNIWPTEAKACDQFLRHKAFLISPSHLLQHYNIKVNKCVSYPGEFVVTYPYGYHSGYNLGYNCAEAVNFALDSWLPMGKIAKKCECAQAQDSVWVDVYEIERKLRGEPSEYEETEDEEEDDDDEMESVIGLPTPASPHTTRARATTRKRKRETGEGDGKKVKKIRLRIKRTHTEPACCLCPNDIPGAEILPTDDGRKAHRMCALYLPETYIESEDDKEIVTAVANVAPARLELKCMYCRSKRGACFQCSYKKCARSYHATCAAAAGVFVEETEVPVFGEDGTEYKEQAFEFTCRFHRTKRDRKLDGDALEKVSRIRDAAAALRKGQICQMQYYRSDIFAGVVVENRPDEETVLLDVIPNGDRVEVEWKWLLLPDPADFRLPKASANALPLPTSRKAKGEINAKKRPADELPRADDVFVEGFLWKEFHSCNPSTYQPSKEQAKTDLSKDNQIWYYLGSTSTESKAQYTEDPAKPAHNPKSNFLDSFPKPSIQRPLSIIPASIPKRSYTVINPPFVPHSVGSKPEKPYVYKPRKSVDALPGSALPPGSQFTGQKFVPRLLPGKGGEQLPFGTDPRFIDTTMGVHPRDLSTIPGPNNRPSLQIQADFSTNNLQYLSHGYAPVSKGWPIPTVSMAQGPQGLRPLVSASAAAAGLSGPSAPSKTLFKPPKQPLSSSFRDVATPVSGLVAAPPAPPKEQSDTFQKYAFFQVNHNRDSTRYRTPYAPWGGFTNGYEGSLRAHLMSTQGRSGHKRNSSSFGLGGGLRGLTRPARHLNYSTPPPFSSTASSPCLSARAAHFGTGAGSSVSSYGSYDAVMTGPNMSPHSPATTHTSPFVGSPGPQMGAFELHAAIRPQFGNPWQNDFSSSLSSFAQADLNFSPPSPILSGMLGPPAHIQSHQSLSSLLAGPMSPPPPPPPPLFSTPTRSPPPPETGDKQTPAEQLRQQLRRISDPSSYSAPHPAIRKEFAAHALVSMSQIPVPMPPPAQAPPPEPQQPKPNIYQPAPRPEPTLTERDTPSHPSHSSPSSPSSQLHAQPLHYPPPALDRAPVQELPEIPANSMGIVERIMLNLKKASRQPA